MNMNMNKNLTHPQPFLRGDLVEIRSMREIAETLDENGKFDGMPFMPEMVQYCGRQFRVYRRADKTCVAGYGLRRMNSAVFLEELRCDGSAHDGCQRTCLFFWKEAWLKPAKEIDPSSKMDLQLQDDNTHWLKQLPTHQDDRYFCQSTELYAATSELSRWSIKQFIQEIRYGELSIRDFLIIVWRTATHRFLGWAEPGTLFGSRTQNHKGDLNLEAGEWVNVKKAEKIRACLDSNGNNCGLSFIPGMSKSIGGRYQVQFPINKIIIEQTGKMAHLTHTVALKGVICQGACSRNCPRSEYYFWRESWLSRAEAPNRSPQ